MTTMPKMSGTSDAQRSSRTFAVSGESGQALANVAETLLATVTECQREMIGFVSMRLGKDGEAAREMLACRDPADATAMQARWLEETLRDYGSEMTRLMTICTAAVNGTGRPGG